GKCLTLLGETLETVGSKPLVVRFSVMCLKCLTLFVETLELSRLSRAFCSSHTHTRPALRVLTPTSLAARHRGARLAPNSTAARGSSLLDGTGPSARSSRSHSATWGCLGSSSSSPRGARWASGVALETPAQ